MLFKVNYLNRLVCHGFNHFTGFHEQGFNVFSFILLYNHVV